MNIPADDGVPLIVTVLFNHDPDTPGGKPENVAPVAPVDTREMFEIDALIQAVLSWPAVIVF